MMENVLTQMTKKLDARVAQITENALVDIMSNLDDNQNILFIQSALNWDINKKLIILMEDMGVREPFDAENIQVATSASIL